MREKQYVTVRCATRSINIRKFCTLHTPFYLIFVTHLNVSRLFSVFFSSAIHICLLTVFFSPSNYQQQEEQQHIKVEEK